LLVIAVAALGAACAVALGVGARAFSSPRSHPRCSDRTSACLKAVAMSYIDALASDDPAMAGKVRAARHVQKWENGVHNAVGRTALVAGIKNTQPLLARIRDIRLFVTRSRRDVFAMFLADGGVGSQPLFTSHVIERIGIQRGLITQLEIVNCIGGVHDQARPKAKDPTGLDFALCTRGPR
jgi:hypothetical protein